MLHHTCIVGDPQQRGHNQRGPTSWRERYITPAFSGLPNNRDKIKAGSKEGGNATSPLHSRGECRGDVAFPPSFGPALILSPLLGSPENARVM